MQNRVWSKRRRKGLRVPFCAHRRTQRTAETNPGMSPMWQKGKCAVAQSTFQVGISERALETHLSKCEFKKIERKGL